MKRWSKEHYCSVQTDSTRNVQAELADETPHILYTSSKKYSLYFFIIATFYSHIYTLVHSVQPWFISAELCSWRKNRNLHGFHFSLSSRMFDVFWRFAEKNRQYQDPHLKVLTLYTWILIFIQASGCIIVRRCFWWILNYMNVKGK